MFLSEEDIKDLTGYKQNSSQIKWLRENGIRFLIGGDDKPRILASQIESLIGASFKQSKRRAEPNEEALNKYMGIA